MKRRHFLSGSLALSAGAALGQTPLPPLPPLPPRLRLGYDNYAVRAMGWKAKELVDHAVKLRVDTVFITDLDAFVSLEENALTEIKNYADKRGIQIYLGTWSICPTSVSFKDKWGTAEEHLRLGLRAAKALGSPCCGWS